MMTFFYLCNYNRSVIHHFNTEKKVEIRDHWTIAYLHPINIKHFMMDNEKQKFVLLLIIFLEQNFHLLR